VFATVQLLHSWAGNGWSQRWVFRKDYGNRNRKQLVPAVLSFAKQGTETGTTYGTGRPTRPLETKIMRHQSQKKS